MKTMRSATADNAQKPLDMGYGFIVLTSNPNNGVSSWVTGYSLQQIRQDIGEDVLLTTGEMPGALCTAIALIS